MEARGLTPCIGNCGATVEWRTNKQIYCEACRLEKKRAVGSVVMAKQRIKPCHTSTCIFYRVIKPIRRRLSPVYWQNR